MIPKFGCKVRTNISKYFFSAGLSDKIHCIPIEAIHALPPKEEQPVDVKISNGFSEGILYSNEALDTQGENDSSLSVNDSETPIPCDNVARKADQKEAVAYNADDEPTICDNICIPSFQSNLNEKGQSISHIDTCDPASIPNIKCENENASNNLQDDTRIPLQVTKGSDIQCNRSVGENGQQDFKEDKFSSDKTNEYASDIGKLEVASIPNYIDVTEKGNKDAFWDFDAAFASTDEQKYEKLGEPSKSDHIDIDNNARSEDLVFDESDEDFGDFGEIVTPDAQSTSNNNDKSISIVEHLSKENTLNTSTESVLNSVSKLMNDLDEIIVAK